VGFAVAAVFVTAACAQQAYTGAWGRGVHVFGHLVLDFGWKTERAGIFQSALIDCSNAQYYCAASRDINIVVPRQCETPQAGEQWSAGGITTRVLGSVSAPAHQYFLLGDEKHPHVLFGYSPAGGVAWVFNDPSKTVDFVAKAKSGGMASYYLTAIQGGKGIEYYNGLTTLDAVARCH